MLIYNIFGSEDSQDVDVMVYMQQLPPTIEQSKKLCKFYDEEIKKELGTDKEVNSNLAIVRDGIITACFKGICVETNNSVFHTYKYHEQKNRCMVKSKIPITNEWIYQKTARAMRIILTFLSRTQYRSEVKAALKGSTRQKLATLLSIDLSTIEDFGKNNNSKEDVLKNIAFQLGQAMGLMHHYSTTSSVELYTKKEIGDFYSELKPFLNREPNAHTTILNAYKDFFVRRVIHREESSPYNVDYDLERFKE